MIEDYQAKRRRSRRIARALQIAGLALAVTAAVVTYLLVAGRPVVPDAAETEPVVVAARDVPARAVLSAQDLRVARIPRSAVPRGAMADAGAAIGRLTSVPLTQNEPILPEKLGAAGSIVAVFPPGQSPAGGGPDYRAMSLRVPDENAVGGTLQPGDSVDIVFALAFEPVTLGTGPLNNDVAARIVAERVPLLGRDADVYTIRVDAAQAERVVAFQAAGATLHLLLRDANDARAPRASGAIFSNEARNLIRAIPTPAR